LSPIAKHLLLDVQVTAVVLGTKGYEVLNCHDAPTSADAVVDAVVMAAVLTPPGATPTAAPEAVARDGDSPRSEAISTTGTRRALELVVNFIGAPPALRRPGPTLTNTSPVHTGRDVPSEPNAR
jgi:hypothetical protein